MTKRWLLLVPVAGLALTTGVLRADQPPRPWSLVKKPAAQVRPAPAARPPVQQRIQKPTPPPAAKTPAALKSPPKVAPKSGVVVPKAGEPLPGRGRLDLVTRGGGSAPQATPPIVPKGWTPDQSVGKATVRPGLPPPPAVGDKIQSSGELWSASIPQVRLGAGSVGAPVGMKGGAATTGGVVAGGLKDAPVPLRKDLRPDLLRGRDLLNDRARSGPLTDLGSRFNQPPLADEFGGAIPGVTKDPVGGKSPATPPNPIGDLLGQHPNGSGSGGGLFGGGRVNGGSGGSLGGAAGSVVSVFGGRTGTGGRPVSRTNTGPADEQPVVPGGTPDALAGGESAPGSQYGTGFGGSGGPSRQLGRSIDTAKNPRTEMASNFGDAVWDAVTTVATDIGTGIAIGAGAGALGEGIGGAIVGGAAGGPAGAGAGFVAGAVAGATKWGAVGGAAGFVVGVAHVVKKAAEGTLGESGSSGTSGSGTSGTSGTADASGTSGGSTSAGSGGTTGDKGDAGTPPAGTNGDGSNGSGDSGDKGDAGTPPAGTKDSTPDPNAEVRGPVQSRQSQLEARRNTEANTRAAEKILSQLPALKGAKVNPVPIDRNGRVGTGAQLLQGDHLPDPPPTTRQATGSTRR
jgi:hypothetical protein